MPDGKFLNETPCSSGGSSGGGFGVGGKVLEQNGYSLARLVVCLAEQGETARNRE